MQATIQLVPTPGRMAAQEGFTHEDLLLVQFREGHDPDAVGVEVAIESIALAATADGSVVQITIPHKALLRTSRDEKFSHVIGDDRIKRAIAMLFGEGFADNLVQRANREIGWETTMQTDIDESVLARQRQIVLWLDAKARDLKALRLAEFTSRTSWALDVDLDG